MNKVITCLHPRCNHGKGNILFIAGADSFYFRHRNPEGSYWERVQVRIPKLFIKFEEAAFVQSAFHGFGNSPKFQQNKIFVKCRNSQCNAWSQVEVIVPGIDFSFDNSAIVRSDLPVGYHFDIEPAPVVVT